MSRAKSRARCHLNKFNSRFPFSRYDEIRSSINIVIPWKDQRFFINLLRRSLISQVEHSYDDTHYAVLFKLIKPKNWQHLRLKNRWRENRPRHWCVDLHPDGSRTQSWPHHPHWSIEKRYSVSPHITEYLYKYRLGFFSKKQWESIVKNNGNLFLI